MLSMIAVLFAVGALVVASGNGGSAARAAGNPQCPPVAAPTPTPTPTVSPPPTPTPTPGTAAAMTYPANCVLPWLPGWRPRLGAVFNQPLGSKADAKAIINRVIAAIRHTPTGAANRIAVYTFDRGDVAYWLRKAKARGVHVQVAVNGAVMSRTARALQRVLGRSPYRRSFLVACDGSCRTRGSGGNLHSKVFSFSRTGGARDLVVVSSGNLTSKAVYRQWNDSFGVANDTGLWDAWVAMFDQIKLQRRTGPRVITYSTTSGTLGASFSRVAARSLGYVPATDPVIQRLRNVGCAAPSGYGARGRTVLRISMYAMFKTRGEALAAELVRLKRAGCDIKMILSVPGTRTYRILQRAGIGLRSADWLFNERDPAVEDGIGGYGPSFYSHYKVMALSGVYAGKPTKTVWTGSENWDGLSFANEEVVMQVSNPAVYGLYLARFATMWSGRATHRMGLEPTYGP